MRRALCCWKTRCCSAARQARVQGEHLGAPEEAARLDPAAERLGRVADLALAGEEDENVAVALARQLLDGFADALDLVLGLAVGLLVVLGLVQRPVAHLDGVGAAGDLDDRGVVEVAAEPLGVDRRRRDDHLEIGTPGQQLLEVAEQEVDVEAPLVRLVDDDRVVAGQEPVALDLREQDAVGHELDQRGRPDLVGEPDGVAHRLADLGVELLRDAFGDGPGGDPPGLRVADRAPDAAAELEAHLGELRGLSRAGLAGDDDDLMVPDRRHQLVARLAHRQLGRVADDGGGGLALDEAQPRVRDVRLDAVEGAVPAPLVADLPDAVEPPADASGVGEGDLAELRREVAHRGCGRSGGLRGHGLPTIGGSTSPGPNEFSTVNGWATSATSPST